MPFIIVPDCREAWQFSWSEIRDQPDSWYADGRYIVTHPDEPRPRPSLSAVAAATLVSVPTDIYAKARRLSGWGSSADAYNLMAPHLPPPPDPLARIAHVAERRRRKLSRKCTVLQRTGMDMQSHACVVRTLVESVTTKGSHPGVPLIRNARMHMRHVDDYNSRRPDETLWSYFTRRFNGGTRPSDLPPKLDTPGEFLGVELEFVPPTRPLEGPYSDSPVARPREGPYSDSPVASLIQSDSAPFGAAFCHDGSVRDNEDRPIDGNTEAVLLLRGDNWDRLGRLCRQLRESGCQVNNTCGVHVHVDVRHLQALAQLEHRVRLLLESLPVLATLVTPARLFGARADRYCRFGLSPTMGDPSDHYDPSRYWAINLCSVPRQGTVEVRLHQGTLDADAIRGWATLVRHLLLKAETPLLSIEELGPLATRLGIGDYVLNAESSGLTVSRLRNFLAESADCWGAYDPDVGIVKQMFAFGGGACSGARPLRRRTWGVPEPLIAPPPGESARSLGDDPDAAINDVFGQTPSPPPPAGPATTEPPPAAYTRDWYELALGVTRRSEFQAGTFRAEASRDGVLLLRPDPVLFNDSGNTL